MSLQLDQIDLGEITFRLDSTDTTTFLNPTTGEVDTLSPYADDSFEDEDHFAGWVEVEVEISSREAYADMATFADAVGEKKWRTRLQDALEGRGAFRRFRSVVFDETDEQLGRAWNDYRRARDELRILEWLEPKKLVDDASLAKGVAARREAAAQALARVRARGTGARMILLNGMPGVGKSTLAARLLAEHPGLLCVEADVLRSWIGGDPADHAEASRRLSLAMAAAHLEDGGDVVLPQLVAKADQLERFAEVAEDAGAQFIHVVLQGLAAADAHEPFEAGLRELLDEDATIHRITTKAGDIDRAYRDLLDVLEDDLGA